MQTKIYIDNRIALINRMLSRPKLFALSIKDIEHYKTEIEILEQIMKQLEDIKSHGYDSLNIPKSINDDDNIVYARLYPYIK